MSAEENKAIIHRWIEEAWNKGNVNIADEIYAPHYIARDVGDPSKVLRGPEDIKKSVAMMRTVFPDIHFTIDHLIAEGDKVVGAFTISGTHKANLFGIAPTGKQIKFAAVDIWRFEEERIAERCLVSVDRLDMMQQLGVIPRIQQTS